MVKKGPSSQNKDIKITAIIVFFVFLASAVFLFFHRKDNTASLKKGVSASKQTPVKKGVFKVEGVPSKTTGTLKASALPMVQGNGAKIAFIIDDWGQSTRNCKYLKEIEDPITVAILPSLARTQEVAKCARVYNKDIILHLPLEAYHNNDPYPTDYIIRTSMKPNKVEHILDSILEKMPFIKGVNNHMGSKATEDPRLMKLIMRHLKRKGLFFIDSMTAPHHSVCLDVARDVRIPFARRDVFLDNINTREEILNQFQSLVLKAKKKGYAIAIGHDRELTLQIIKEQIAQLKRQGFRIVAVKDLLKTP